MVREGPDARSALEDAGLKWCEHHDREVVLCSCGFQRVSPKPVLPPADRTQVELAEVWNSWTDEERKLYEYWLDLTKPFEALALQAACYSARKVEQN